MKKTTLLMCVIFSFILSPIFVEVAHAETQVNLEDVPQYLGERLGISTFAGGILASIIFTLIIFLPSAMLIRGKHASIFMVIEGLGMFSFCIAIGWLPVWLIIILVFIVAVLFAKTWGDVFK